MWPENSLGGVHHAHLICLPSVRAPCPGMHFIQYLKNHSFMCVCSLKLECKSVTPFWLEMEMLSMTSQKLRQTTGQSLLLQSPTLFPIIWD